MPALGLVVFGAVGLGSAEVTALADPLAPAAVISDAPVNPGDPGDDGPDSDISGPEDTDTDNVAPPAPPAAPGRMRERGYGVRRR
ncbi:hypothetical protein I540_1061 [Mycobacteroides abscessus subsp. bolletii 1513]|uniref:Uncharacterized protein n=1 Tax=Mycobacteroides abscessus subsp. bolletii 1513 TaxID=1299321 RepID=X8DTH8_9MYCO|nr:hypothetical protein I540_1061 [Mycobacteroides abscessus subsp. bolletii 1513]